MTVNANIEFKSFVAFIFMLKGNILQCKRLNKHNF